MLKVQTPGSKLNLHCKRCEIQETAPEKPRRLEKAKRPESRTAWALWHLCGGLGPVHRVIWGFGSWPLLELTTTLRYVDHGSATMIVFLWAEKRLDKYRYYTCTGHELKPNSSANMTANLRVANAVKCKQKTRTPHKDVGKNLYRRKHGCMRQKSYWIFPSLKLLLDDFVFEISVQISTKNRKHVFGWNFCVFTFFILNRTPDL